jgi:hypothetical protein
MSASLASQSLDANAIAGAFFCLRTRMGTRAPPFDVLLTRSCALKRVREAGWYAPDDHQREGIERNYKYQLKRSPAGEQIL